MSYPYLVYETALNSNEVRLGRQNNDLSLLHDGGDGGAGALT